MSATRGTHPFETFFAEQSMFSLLEVLSQGVVFVARNNLMQRRK
jgi:hypothetical protein